MILVDIVIGTTKNTHQILGFGHTTQAQLLPAYITSHVSFLPNIHINVSILYLYCASEKLAIFAIFHPQSGKFGNIHPTPAKL